MSTSARSRRIVGITVPLFSLRTASCWGIGEIPDLARFGALARLTWIAVPARKSTGFHYAPSFEMLALGGPQGSKRWEATVATTVSFIGFEWY